MQLLSVTTELSWTTGVVIEMLQEMDFGGQVLVAIPPIADQVLDTRQNLGKKSEAFSFEIKEETKEFAPRVLGLANL